MVVSFSHYELLGLKPNATETEIKKAVHLMSRSLHPDKNPQGHNLMQQINNAKETLLDQSKRSAYDHVELRNHQSDSYNSRNGSSSREVRRLRSQLSAAQQELTQSKRELTTLRRSHANLTRRNHNLESKNDVMSQRLSVEELEHKILQDKYKKVEKQNIKLKTTNQNLESEKVEQACRIDTYEVKMDRISRELREERKQSSFRMAIEKEKFDNTITGMQNTLSIRSVCYRCDGKAACAASCSLCGGSGAVEGRWTKCHNCDGAGSYLTLDGKDVSCTLCFSKGAREGLFTMTCFKCKGKNDGDCKVCYKGKLRGFNLKLCPICNGESADGVKKCENCHGRAYVSCQCGSWCKGHTAFQRSEPATPSSLQRVLALKNGDEEMSSYWKAKFLSRNWDVLILQKDDVKGIFL